MESDTSCHHRASQKDHAMTHDPLCVLASHPRNIPSINCENCTSVRYCTCECDLIAKVRADEQMKAGQRVNSLPRGASLSVAAAAAAGDVDAGASSEHSD